MKNHQNLRCILFCKYTRNAHTILAWIGSLIFRQLSGNLSMASFFGWKSFGNDCEGYPHHFNTRKLLGRCVGPLLKRPFLIKSVLRFTQTWWNSPKQKELGEIPPHFVEKIFDELGEDWTIVDQKGTKRKIKFDENRLNLRIIEWWEQLRTDDVLFGHHPVVIYFGDKYFEIYMSSDRIKTKDFHLYHSLSNPH